MHDGFKIVRFRDIWEKSEQDVSIGERWEIARTFDKHQSLAYGADWSYAEGQDGQETTAIATASFYDHSLYLWRG